MQRFQLRPLAVVRARAVAPNTPPAPRPGQNPPAPNNAGRPIVLARTGHIPIPQNRVKFAHVQLCRAISLPIPPPHNSIIGRGGFGEVKIISKDENDTPITPIARKHIANRDMFWLEWNALNKIRIGGGHPAILNILGYSQIDQTIDTPFMERGSLRHLLVKQIQAPFFKYWDVLGWTLDILSAIEFMNVALNISHLDVKPDNIFIDRDFNAILGDIGATHEYPIRAQNHPITPGFAPPEANIELPDAVKTAFGNILPPLGPEFPNYDVFSLGCVIILCLYTGQSVQSMYENLEKTLYWRQNLPFDLRFWRNLDNVPDDFLKILNLMISWDPQVRPNATGVLNFPNLFEIRSRYANPRWDSSYQRVFNKLQEREVEINEINIEQGRRARLYKRRIAKMRRIHLRALARLRRARRECLAAQHPPLPVSCNYSLNV
jgi:serine/threonine protein kinase